MWFGAAEALDTIWADDFLQALLLGGVEVREFEQGRLVDYPVEEQARLIIDPFLASGKRLAITKLSR